MSNIILSESEYPEMDLFMHETMSDVVFIVEGQRVPAMKQVLILKSRVFRAMFLDNYKESKDKEIAIEDTNFEAFKTMIQFFYCNQLILKDDNDLDLIYEVYRLLDRYGALRLMKQISDKLNAIQISVENAKKNLKIASNHEIEGLMSKTVKFIQTNLDEFFQIENIEYNDIVFIIEEQKLPALTHFLFKNNVLKDMIANNVRDNEIREVVIGKTTFDAFKTFVQFLYCSELILRSQNNPQLIEEVCELSNLYQTPILMEKISAHLMKLELSVNNAGSIIEIAYSYNIEVLASKVIAYINDNIRQFFEKDIEELIKINDTTNNRLLKAMATNYAEISASYESTKITLDQTQFQLNNAIQNPKCKTCGNFDFGNEYRCLSCRIANRIARRR